MSDQDLILAARFTVHPLSRKRGDTIVTQSRIDLNNLSIIWSITSKRSKQQCARLTTQTGGRVSWQFQLPTVVFQRTFELLHSSTLQTIERRSQKEGRTCCFCNQLLQCKFEALSLVQSFLWNVLLNNGLHMNLKHSANAFDYWNNSVMSSQFTQTQGYCVVVRLGIFKWQSLRRYLHKGWPDFPLRKENVPYLVR